MPIRGTNWLAVAAAARTIIEDSGNEPTDIMEDLPATPDEDSPATRKGESLPDDNAVISTIRRTVSGRFVVESVQQQQQQQQQQQWLPDQAAAAVAVYTTTPTAGWKPSQHTSRSMSESEQPRLKSILKNIRSVSANHPPDDEILSSVCPRRKRVSFSEIVTEQLYKTEPPPQPESNRKKAAKNKTNQASAKKKARKKRQGRQGFSERCKQLESQISESILELVSSCPMKVTATHDHHDTVLIEEEEDWTEVTYRRPIKGYKGTFKEQDSEPSDESGLGSLPSSFDETQGSSLAFVGLHDTTLSQFAGYRDEDGPLIVNSISDRLRDISIGENAACCYKQ